MVDVVVEDELTPLSLFQIYLQVVNLVHIVCGDDVHSIAETLIGFVFSALVQILVSSIGLAATVALSIAKSVAVLVAIEHAQGAFASVV